LVLFRSRHLDLLALPGLNHRRSCPKMVATGSTGPDLGRRWICPPRLRSPRFRVAMPNFIRHRCTLPGHRVDGDPSLHVDATPLQCPGPFPLGGPPRASSWAGSHEIVAGTPVFDVQKQFVVSAGNRSLVLATESYTLCVIKISIFGVG
jgi:hypothetical protein